MNLEVYMKNIRSNIAAKTGAYLLLALASLTTRLSAVGIGAAVNGDYYVLSAEQLKEQLSSSYPLHMFVYNQRYLLIGLCTASVLLCIISFLFLILSAGHQKGQEGIRKSWLTSIPLDLFTGLTFFILMLIFAIGDAFNSWELFVYILFAFPASVVILTAFLADCAIRIKLGKWWRNSLLFYTWIFLLKLGKNISRFGQELFSSLPLLWKAILGMVLLFLLEILFILLCSPYGEEDAALLLIWLGEKILFYPLFLYLILVLRKLQSSGRELARGNLAHQTDTTKMFWDFKEHGENLNSIALGMSRAVEERLRSERMKTELITNVSHDIKTPLTSIINYSDLIAAEETGNPDRLKEYASALHRQSRRLKKLLEDLMDASKISTGNVEVLLAPCETDVLLTQAVGEYGERLKEQGLELMIKRPKQPLKILVDSKHIWRVFDNLMNNICKYAQEGTRVYLTLEKKEEKAVFSLKNTSRNALDISAEELMERFVRGDRSRHTEGSGLGLSIARSLTNLQNGEFDLTIDGDLFKVVLTFHQTS